MSERGFPDIASRESHIFVDFVEPLGGFTDDRGYFVRKDISQHVIGTGQIIGTENIAVNVWNFHDGIQIFNSFPMLDLNKTAHGILIGSYIFGGVLETVIYGIHRTKAPVAMEGLHCPRRAGIADRANGGTSVSGNW